VLLALRPAAARAILARKTPELPREAGGVGETGSVIVRRDMRAEPAMFANSLNELLLVLVEPFRAGIKGCEYECTSGRVERWGVSQNKGRGVWVPAPDAQLRKWAGTTAREPPTPPRSALARAAG
jgi:hypothetical protein